MSPDRLPLAIGSEDRLGITAMHLQTTSKRFRNCLEPYDRRSRDDLDQFEIATYCGQATGSNGTSGKRAFKLPKNFFERNCKLFLAEFALS